LADVLGGEKRLEGALHDLLGHARTVICNAERYIGPSGDASTFTLPWIDDLIRRTQPNGAARNYGVARIDDEVEEGGLKLSRICVDVVKVWF